VRPRSQRGFTLIEVMVVMAIVGGLAATIVVGAAGLRRSEMKRTAARLAGAMRFCFDRALTTGRTYRLVLDLDAQKYWVEVTDDRYLLPVDKQRALEEEDEEKRKREGEAEPPKPSVGSSDLAALGAPGDLSARLPRARFSEYKNAALGTASLGRAHILGVWTGGAAERQTEGKAMLYYFPQGFAERAIVHVGTADAVEFSLVQHPLTGHVAVDASEIEAPPRDEVDDTGAELKE
jgi:general secretion pathway protein H